MTGVSGPSKPPVPAPPAMPVPGREEELAKKKVTRRRGRSANILAGVMMQGRNILNLRNKLGE